MKSQNKIGKQLKTQSYVFKKYMGGGGGIIIEPHLPKTFLCSYNYFIEVFIFEIKINNNDSTDRLISNHFPSIESQNERVI